MIQETTKSVVNYKAYNVVESDALLAQVSKIICIMLPKAFVIGGFSDRGDMLMIRYNDYPNDIHDWVPDFFDHRFAEEPLLARPELVIAIYVLTDKYVVVPNELYDPITSKDWLKNIYFVEENENVDAFHINEEKVQYVYAWPSAIKGLASRYCPNARFLPLGAFQFTQLYKADSAIQVAITNNAVVATYYKHRKLQWHQVFKYQSTEDIVYRLMQVCNQYQQPTDELDVFFTTANSDLNSVASNLSSYFPHIKAMEAGVMVTNPVWASTVSLFQRLYTCAL
jgi:hypothetical protein